MTHRRQDYTTRVLVSCLKRHFYKLLVSTAIKCMQKNVFIKYFNSYSRNFYVYPGGSHLSPSNDLYTLLLTQITQQWFELSSCWHPSYQVSYNIVNSIKCRSLECNNKLPYDCIETDALSKSIPSCNTRTMSCNAANASPK